MRNFWWELIFALASLAAALIVYGLKESLLLTEHGGLLLPGLRHGTACLNASLMTLKNGGNALDNPCT